MTENQTMTDTTPARTFAGITQEQMSTFRRQHGDDAVKPLSAPTHQGQRLEIVVRAPTRDEYDRYVETMVKIEKKTAQALAANRTILMSCLLAPSAADVKPALDRFPALVDKFAEKVLEMAGAEAEVREEIF